MLTPWKKMMNKTYLGSWDLPTDGKDLVLTIDKAYQDDVQNKSGGKDKCLIISFKEQGYKPLILNNTNATSVEKATGSKYIEDWSGKRIALFSASVSAFGTITDAVRIRNSEPKEPVRYECDECHKAIIDSDGMDAETISEYTFKKYGKHLCADCAKKEKDKK
jgi:hypothetical protein